MWEWEQVVGTGREAELSVGRGDREAADDVDELEEMIETARYRSPDGHEDEELTES